jgi:hypothetical protein
VLTNATVSNPPGSVNLFLSFPLKIDRRFFGQGGHIAEGKNDGYF